MATLCQYEFKWEKFGFGDCQQIRFYRSQWGPNRIAFVAYRMFMFVYALTWYVIQVSVLDIPFYIFLTNWTEASGCLYFTLSAAVAIYGLFVGKNRDKKQLQWFHKLVWVLFNVTFSAALGTDLAFWILLSRSLAENGFNLSSAFIIHSHAINFLMIFIDLFVTSKPIRLLHFVYPMTYGLVYVLYTLILHWTGFTSAVYMVMDWAQAPGEAAGYALVICIIFLPLLHVVGFGFYHYRAWVARAYKFEPLIVNESNNDCNLVSENTTFANFNITPK